MKKIITCLTLGLALSASALVAQDSTTATSSSLKSKRGAEILPQAGDWGFGISATGTLNYMGNLFSGNDDYNDVTNEEVFGNSSNPFQNDNQNFTLFGKKFIDAKTAYRVRLGITATTETTTGDVSKSELTPDLNYPQTVQDQQINRQGALNLAVGKEMRRGSHRVQGVYGAEVLLGVYTYSNKFTYGNDITVDFNQPDTYFGFSNNGERELSGKNGVDLFVGARGFIGVEYFFAPKMSIGGEIGYTLGISKEGNSSKTYEKWDPSTNSVLEVVRKTTNKASFSGISTDNLNGAVNLLFYF